MENWAATRSQLSQALEVERTLACQRRQQQWQQLLQEGKRLRAFLVLCLINF
ncbi:MAG: hypothetical protein R3E79_46640 [Caldilineaceae bacterium]